MYNLANKNYGVILRSVTYPACSMMHSQDSMSQSANTHHDIHILPTLMSQTLRPLYESVCTATCSSVCCHISHFHHHLLCKCKSSLHIFYERNISVFWDVKPHILVGTCIRFSSLYQIDHIQQCLDSSGHTPPKTESWLGCYSTTYCYKQISTGLPLMEMSSFLQHVKDDL